MRQASSRKILERILWDRMHGVLALFATIGGYHALIVYEIDSTPHVTQAEKLRDVAMYGLRLTESAEAKLRDHMRDAGRESDEPFEVHKNRVLEALDELIDTILGELDTHMTELEALADLGGEYITDDGAQITWQVDDYIPREAVGGLKTYLGKSQAVNQLADTFTRLLQDSADGFIWSVGQIPTGRFYVQPLPVFGEWSVARLVFHITFYEAHIALPHMRYQFDALPGDPQEEIDAWRENSSTDMVDLLARFRAVRDEQIALLWEIDDWDAPLVSPFWGEVTPRFVMMKTYQHTLEHSDTLMKMGTFWDLFLAQQEKRKQED